MPDFAADESLKKIFIELERKPASYLSASRHIESFSTGNLQPVRLTVLSSFTAEVLRPYIVTEGARHGMKVAIQFCPFNQLEIQALDPNSDLYRSRPDLIVVAWRLEDIASELIWRYAALAVTEIE